MSQSEESGPPAAPRGAIYDLGYQRYDGPRLGRAYALWSLFVLSVRNAFGFGRGALPKVLAFALVGLAFVPAVVQLVTAAVVPVEDFSFVQPEEYYGFIQVILVLFVAAIASDLVGNDRRNRTLTLYFSRPLLRDDYAAIKIAALASGLLMLTVVPQLVMFAGNWLGASDGIEFLQDNAGDLLPIVVSGGLVCLFFASLGIAVAAYAERRSFAMVTILILFLVTFTVVQQVIAIVDADWGRYALFASPIHVMRGFTLVMFDAVPVANFNAQEGGPAQQIAYADFPGVVYIGAALAYTAVAAVVTVRRYRGSV